MPAPRKLDPAPLVTASGQPLRGLARRLNIDPAVLCRPITLDQADRYAIAIGHHPIEIWGPDAFWGEA